MNPFIDARNAGLSPFPVKKGSKVPAISWKQFQLEICSELQATEWGNGGGYSIGLVTGEVSGRLMAVDIEASFMPRIAELGEAMRVAGVGAVFDSWMSGYSESTPRGGLHVLVRLEGSGPCPRNDVFARGSDGKVLIETRGEGGYILVAPSPGYKVTGGSYDQIVYCTLEEWARVEAVLSSFDDTPETEPPALTVGTRSTVPSPPILWFEGDRWIDDAVAALGDIRVPMQANGWTTIGVNDEYGEHWTRPGKDPRQGSSGSISVNNRLYVHSSNAGMHVGNPTYDVLDVILFYELGRDPSDRDRVEYLKAQRPAPAEESGVGAAPSGGPQVAVPNLSPDVCIDDWFWEARALFRQIRDSAMQRGLSPDGVFGAWLSGYAATIPMGIWVAGPPTRAPLNIFSCLVGNPGTGKTSSMRVAADLLGWNPSANPHVLLGRPLRSGEGLIKLATIPPKKGDELAGPSYRNAVQVAFDEGSVLGKQTDRTGSSTIPVLNSAWSGDAIIGGALAKEVLEFPANLVRICVVMGVQYGAAANLFTGEAHRQGFPQRFLYFGLKHPAQADADVDLQVSATATPLDLPFWAHNEYSGRPLELEYPADIERQIRLWTRNKDHGDGLDDNYDAHQMNQTKRVGVILALADGRGTPNDQDWALASHVYETSRRIRNQLRAGLKGIDMERRQARINEAVQTADAIDRRTVQRQAARIARYIHTTNNDCTLKDIKTRLNPTERPHRDDYITYALQMNWITRGDDDHFHPGPSQPA